MSSNVGGVHEVLPADMLSLAAPTPAALADAAVAALAVRRSAAELQAQHRRIASMCAWADVARQTAEVYEQVLAAAPERRQTRRTWSLLSSAVRHGGAVLGWLLGVVVLLASLVVQCGHWRWRRRRRRE